MKNILNKLYNYVLKLSETKYAMLAMIFVSFFGSIIFPLPTEIIMIPMILARPSKAFYITTIALITSVLGGIAGYFVGAVFFENIGSRILSILGYTNMFNDFSALYNKFGYWIVFAGGLTPFPYKVICIASGVFKMNLAIFIMASAISRAVRYYFISYLLYKYGDKAKIFIEKHLEMLTIVAFILLILTVYLIKLL